MCWIKLPHHTFPNIFQPLQLTCYKNNRGTASWCWVVRSRGFSLPQACLHRWDVFVFQLSCLCDGWHQDLHGLWCFCFQWWALPAPSLCKHWADPNSITNNQYSLGRLWKLSYSAISICLVLRAAIKMTMYRGKKKQELWLYIKYFISYTINNTKNNVKLWF